MLINSKCNSKSSLVLADLHLHHTPDRHLSWCEQFVDYLSTNPYNVDNLILLGDATEIRDKLDARVANLILKLVTGWSGNNNGNVYWITGQHDSYTDGIATFDGLNGLKLANGGVVNIISNHVEKVDFPDESEWYFIPFQRRDERYRELLSLIPDNAYVLTHLPVREAIPQLKTQTDKGMSVTEFSRFSFVLSGDIHKYTTLGNFHYVGAPKQLNFKDMGVVGQVGIIAPDGGFERHPTKHYVHIEIDDPSQVPVGVDFIAKVPAGMVLEGDNVLDVISVVDVKKESVSIQARTESPIQLVEKYMAIKAPENHTDLVKSMVNDYVNGT